MRLCTAGRGRRRELQVPTPPVTQPVPRRPTATPFDPSRARGREQRRPWRPPLGLKAARRQRTTARRRSPQRPGGSFIRSSGSLLFSSLAHLSLSLSLILPPFPLPSPLPFPTFLCGAAVPSDAPPACSSMPRFLTSPHPLSPFFNGAKETADRVPSLPRGAACGASPWTRRLLRVGPHTVPVSLL